MRPRRLDAEESQCCQEIVSLVNSRAQPLDLQKAKDKGELLNIDPDEDPSRLSEDERDSMFELYSETSQQEVLYTLIVTWIASGYDLAKWSRRQWFEKVINRRTVYLTANNSQPTLSIKWRPSHGKDAAEGVGRMDAAKLFLRFVTSGLYNRIGRCLRCKAFFFFGSRHNRVFCSKRCARGHHATKGTKTKRKVLRDQKLNVLAQAIQEWNSLTRAERARMRHQGMEVPDCVLELARRMNFEIADEITTHFLMRTVRRGDLLRPVGL